MKDGAATSIAMSIDQIGNRGIDAGLPERGDNEAAFPGAVWKLVEVLHGASAADAEMRADRRDALGTRLVDVKKLPSVGMTGNIFDFDGFAGQGAANENRLRLAIDHAIAAMAEAIDH
jgi:hypothetical protein